MQRHQAFKYELMPSGGQQRDMRRFAGSCRFVFNQALALQKERYAQGEQRLGYAGLCQRLTGWPNSTQMAWLADAPVHPLQQALKDLERAYANYFAKRAQFPRFQKKGESERFRYPDPKQIKLDQVNSRLFLVSIQTQRDVEQPLAHGGAVGIDMGVARFATLSDGTFYAPLNRFRRHEDRLRRAQRAMSRKEKFSSNWKKAKGRVQHIHARIDNTRRDYLHKATTTISQNHAMVCIEDLQVRNMSKSASGTIEAPGRNVRAKSGLNKSILDQGWFEFRRQLDYSWPGRADFSWPYHRSTRAEPARAAAMSAKTTARAKRASNVSDAVSKHTPMWSARSMYKGRDTPG